jgi:hypothetical protein
VKNSVFINICFKLVRFSWYVLVTLFYVPYDTITYTYDNKRNPFSVQTDPDIVFIPYNLLRDFRYYNANNLLSQTYTNAYSFESETTYSYIYNSDNYPVSRTTTDSGSWTEYYNY